MSGAPSPWEGTEKLKPTIKLKVDDGEIAVLPFVFCLFQPYLGDLQKEKLQIVSIYRFGLKIRGLFQCPPLGKAGMGLLCLLVRTPGNSDGVAIT